MGLFFGNTKDLDRKAVWDCANAGNLAMGKPHDRVSAFDMYCAAQMIVLFLAGKPWPGCLWHGEDNDVFANAVRTKMEELRRYEGDVMLANHYWAE